MTDNKRRKLITFMGAATVAVPVSALIGSLPSHADDTPLVDENSAAAKTWEYVSVSADESKTCRGCALYGGGPDDKSGTCPLFQGSHVAPTAYCKSYTPRPG